MAQPASSPKIEELRFRIKTDPKSRLFFPLAEELRKVSQFGEAEQVLRTGLTNHPTYLSAWVSLGRVLRDMGKDRDAVDALSKALQLDPGNVVAARLLADAYLALGEKVEAIKKYKLVHALLPADEDLEGVIEHLERELNPPPVAAAPPSMEEAIPEPAAADMPWSSEAEPQAEPLALGEPQIFEQAETVFAKEEAVEAAGDLEPMASAHAESPFEEPAVDFGYSSNALELEQPEAMHVEEPAPVSAELPAEIVPPESAPSEPEIVSAYEPEDVFAPAGDVLPPPRSEEPFIEVGNASEMPFPLTSELEAPAPDDFAKTITMADLYAKQGLVDEARDIYEDILARDPNNEAVRTKLDALSGPSMEEPEPVVASAAIGVSSGPEGKIARLEDWLAKVARRESGGV